MKNKVVTTTTGVKLEEQPLLTQYAASKGLTGYEGWLATFPTGEQKYCLTLNREPVFDTTSIEDFGFHIDKLSILKNMEKNDA